MTKDAGTRRSRRLSQAGDRTRTGDVQLGKGDQIGIYPPTAPNSGHVGTRPLYCANDWRKRRKLDPPRGANDGSNDRATNTPRDADSAPWAMDPPSGRGTRLLGELGLRYLR
jgi:hypothetical protein